MTYRSPSEMVIWMSSQGMNEAVSNSFHVIGHCFGRRRFVAGLFPTISLFLNKNALATTTADAEFFHMSHFLTGREIDEGFAERFLKALRFQDAEFDKKMAHLARSIASQAPKSIDALDMGALSSVDKACALTIISAWYTGVVGAGSEAVVITFNSAFLYDATRDAIVVPTYCVWKPSYWTQAPPKAPMTGFTIQSLPPPVWIF